MRFAALTLTSAALLTACGGGGGGGGSAEDLILTFSYTPQTVGLWGDINEQPNISGLEGRTPTCSVSAGRLPDGVTVSRNSCVVSGQPNETGDFGATIRLTVSGYSGYVETTYSTTVVALRPTYDWEIGGATPAWGISFRQTPWISWFTRRSGDVITYEHLGGLPGGLQVNASSGMVSGIPLEAGTFRPFIRVTITRDGRTYQSVAEQGPMAVAEPVVSISYPTPTLEAGVDYQVLPDMVDSLLDSVYPTYSYSLSDQPGCPGVLPAGWTLSKSTGVVSGTATEGLNQCVGVQLQVRKGSLVRPYDMTLQLRL